MISSIAPKEVNLIEAEGPFERVDYPQFLKLFRSIEHRQTHAGVATVYRRQNRSTQKGD